MKRSDLATLALLAAASGSGCGASVEHAAQAEGPAVTRAIAVMQPTQGNQVRGIVTFTSVAGGVRIWQQRTNIPKDSENWFSEWYPSAVRARKIVCFISADYLKSPYCMKEWRVAESKNKLLVVACEPLSQIAAVDPAAYPQASNALAYLDGGGQVIFNGRDDIAAEIRKFL